MYEDDRDYLDLFIDRMLFIDCGIFSFGIMESCWLWLVIYPVVQALYLVFSGRVNINDQ